jgi:hypothetical protein
MRVSYLLNYSLVSKVCLLRFCRAIQPHTAPHPYTHIYRYTDYNNTERGKIIINVTVFQSHFQHRTKALKPIS